MTLHVSLIDTVECTLKYGNIIVSCMHNIKAFITTLIKLFIDAIIPDSSAGN